MTHIKKYQNFISIAFICFLQFCKGTEKNTDTSFNQTNDIMIKEDNIEILFDKICSRDAINYNPIYIINATNELMALGKENALFRIENYYSKIEKDKETLGLFLLLRVLFNIPETETHLKIEIGKFDIEPPANETEIPLFPIMIVDEVPLLIVQGYFLAGFPQSLEEHISFYSEKGTIRENSIKVIVPKNKIIEDFTESWEKSYKNSPSEKLINHIKNQLSNI